MATADRIIESFQGQFQISPRAVSFAPGRVNLIGEHTDYNDGFVMPLAIQYGVYAAGAIAVDGRVLAHSRNFPEQPAAFGWGEAPRGQTWVDFLQAILLELDTVGVRPAGLRLAFCGDVPAEAGLSSSAAFAVAAVLLVSALAGKTWPNEVALAKVCQAAEHRLGVKCGLLDQMASAACRAGSAMLLDCRDFSRRMIPIDRHRLAVIVGATGVRRALTGSKYNERRDECEQGARACGASSLRDVSRAKLEEARSALPERVYRRCRHVLTENQRVMDFATALAESDWRQAGRLVTASHASLRDDYEVSCLELDAMVQAFLAAEGVFGARMVGAGFGGSAIALADPGKTGAIIAATVEDFRRQVGREGMLYVATAGDGARVQVFD